MIDFFIYHDHCYIQYEWIDDADIAGEYLGTAAGLIDEWTAGDGYVELAGSVNGGFYSVKGYDPESMLCMKYETGGICTYICNNGFTLKYGSELYEDRLHLSENYTAVQYEARESWNFDKKELYQINADNEAVKDFIAALDQAEFIPWNDAVSREGMTEYSMVNDKKIYHMYFAMENGTTIHLRLYKNGYVRFQGLMDICVQVPEDSCDSLTGLMESRSDSQG